MSSIVENQVQYDQKAPSGEIVQSQKKEEPRMSFLDKCIAGWKAGVNIADGASAVTLGGAAGSGKAKVMLVGGETLQVVGAIGAIASGVPGWVTACLIGGNASILGGAITGFRQGVADLKKKQEAIKAAMAQMPPEVKAKLEEQMKAAATKKEAK